MNLTLYLDCPVCEQELTVEVAGPHKATRYDPGAGPEIMDLTGCAHVEALLEDDAFSDTVCEVAEDEARGRWEDAMEARRDEGGEA